jgi:hypothetical protein
VHWQHAAREHTLRWHVHAITPRAAEWPSENRRAASAIEPTTGAGMDHHLLQEVCHLPDVALNLAQLLAVGEALYTAATV